MNIKKISCITAIILIAAVFAACGNSSISSESETAEEKISIVATTFPQYDWIYQILGDRIDNFDLILLADSSIDLHNFQPSVQDIAEISDCDMFVYTGGESDAWVDAALNNAANKDMIAISLLEVLGDIVKEEEIVDGMESDYEHEHEGEATDEHEHEKDEHVWLSLKNAQIICKFISDELGRLDPDSASIYTASATEYISKLSALDAEYEKVIEGTEYDTLLFGDRFPFRYLFDDYGINYYAAFSGCSAETEASFETIVFLANKTDELKLGSVMVIDGSDNSIAKTIIDNTASKNQSILMLNSMQSTTLADVASGINYLSIMEDNLNVLTQALN